MALATHDQKRTSERAPLDGKYEMEAEWSCKLLANKPGELR